MPGTDRRARWYVNAEWFGAGPRMRAPMARIAQLAELVCGGLGGWQHHDEVLLAVAGGGELDVVETEQARQRLEALRHPVDTGGLRPQVQSALPLDQARQALTQVADRHTRGKIVLQVGQ
jgi:NADPH:quinone reductase-like Zn-dependent oxidoreductase